MKHLRRGSLAFALVCAALLWRSPQTFAQPAATSGDPSAPKPNVDKASSSPKPGADKARPGASSSDNTSSTVKPNADKARANPAVTPNADAPKAVADKGSAGAPGAEKARAGAPSTDKVTADKASADKVNSDRANAGRPTADKVTADKASADKVNSDRANAGRPAADKVSAERANAGVPTTDKAAEKPAIEKPAAEKATGETPAGASASALASANVEKARQHFQRGIDSYRDGDLATALIEFKRAYSTAPNYRLLYNLGQVSADLRDYPAAERYLNQYLEESRNALDEARKLAVQDDLARVRARIAYVHLTSNVEGAEVLVDDVLIGRTPLQAPVHVSTGRRRITGRAPGHAPITQIVDAAGGEDVPVTLHLQPIPSTLAERPAVTPPVYRRGGTRKPLLLGLAIGAGLLAAGGAVFGYLAEADAVEYRDALQRKTSANELQDLADGAKTYALVTDFLIGAALLTATVGTVVLLSTDIETRDQAQLRVGLGRIEVSKRF